MNNVLARKLMLGWALIAFAIIAPQSVLAQQTAEAIGAEDSLSAPADLAERRIGYGDVLDIRTINEPKYSREGVRVDSRGLIIIPYIDVEIQAACKTESELAQAITRYYLEYLRHPQVDVFIKDYQAQPASVIGAVKLPGRFQLQRRMRLLELLTFAGGPEIEQAGRYIHIIHAAQSPACEPPGAKQGETKNETSFESYELGETLRGVERANPFIQPGDIISVPKTEQVYVVGNVYKPSTIALNEPVTVSQAIAMAGGTIRDSKSDRIRIIRSLAGGTAKTEIIVDLKAIEKRKADDVALQANDIVDVPVSGTKSMLRTIMGAIVPSVSQLPIQVIR